MALTPIEQVRLMVGDTQASPFYPQLTDDEIQFFLDQNNQSVPEAARWAASSLMFTIAGYNIREQTGDILVWNEYAKNYLAALKLLLTNPLNPIPSGLMPWSANSGCPSKLLTIQVCDDDDRCCTTGCDSSGKTF